MNDRSEAFHQLYLLTDERDPAIHWQVFCDYDHAKKELARSYYGTLSELAPALQSAQEQGCGVFVSVNEFIGARKKEDLFAIRAIFLDFDAAPFPESFPEEPQSDLKQLSRKASSLVAPLTRQEQRSSFGYPFSGNYKSATGLTSIAAATFVK